MRIGIVGGVDRNAGALQDIAHARGHHLELHTGVLASAASAATLRALVGRSELVVIVISGAGRGGSRSRETTGDRAGGAGGQRW